MYKIEIQVDGKWVNATENTFNTRKSAVVYGTSQFKHAGYLTRVVPCDSGELKIETLWVKQMRDAAAKCK